MQLYEFFLGLGVFFSLLTTLASLPADGYFHPWHDTTQPHRIHHDSYRPPFLGSNDPRVSPFGQRDFGGAPGLPPYAAPPHERWYRMEQAGTPVAPHRRQWEHDGAPAPALHRRHSDFVPGDEYPGVQNIGNSYSSHVNCDTRNQNDEAAEKTAKTFRENIEPIYSSGKIDERINFEETSRNMAKEVDFPNPRIVTPKGGRRPSQGSSVKNQNKPFNPGVTNPGVLPTTEKTFWNQTSKGSKKPRPNNAKPQGGDIVFPDGYPKKFIPRISKCAKKSTFCEHLGEEYPTDYINQVLKKEGAMFREFFGRDVIRDPNITERINAPEENSLCPYRQEVVFPRAAQNKEDKWLFIVNQDQYVQGVTVEVCLNPESRCILTEGFPLGYTPYCKQKYIERRLVAIGEDGKPHSDSFRLPSCCSCVVKHETSARMGLLRSSSQTLTP